MRDKLKELFRLTPTLPLTRKGGTFARVSRRHVNREGWDGYARKWNAMKDHGRIPGLRSDDCGTVQSLGDEWSLMEDTKFPYGVGTHSAEEFLDYVAQNLLDPYLPAGNDLNVMEIGPGGGRITQLLLPRCRTHYAVDISSEMLRRLRSRFQSETKMIPILTDGIQITGVPQNALDAMVSFDAFVHLEHWEIFRYLEITRTLLKNSGIGVVHFADVETPIGFRAFRSQVARALEIGVDYGMFPLMNKSVMCKFLQELDFEILSVTNGIIPRDAVAIFRKTCG